MIYSYQCCVCGSIIDKQYPINAPHPHPRCCNKETRRLFTTSIAFKGGGWPSKAIKIDNIVREQEEIMNTPIESKLELETGIGMAKEREKRRGIPEGRISGQGHKKRGKEVLTKEAREQLKQHGH